MVKSHVRQIFKMHKILEVIFFIAILTIILNDYMDTCMTIYCAYQGCATYQNTYINSHLNWLNSHFL